MVELEHLWPDPDRRDDALLRIAARVGAQPEPREWLTTMERRTLEAMSRGLGRDGTADILGLSVETVKSHLAKASRALRAKNVTHACCEALRQGLIT